MTENLTLLDPTSELTPVARERLDRPASLEGLTLGLLDISKARGNIFLDTLEEMFTAEGVKVRRYIKPTFARPAPVELRQQIATEVDVVVEGLAD